MATASLDDRLDSLAARGVVIVDPRQTFVAPQIAIERVCPGATLHPGTRLEGRRTFIGAGAQVGAQGPATVRDSVLGAGACVDAGFVDGAVLLAGARVGWGAHVRPGTLLEEHASTAHCVGLKHTILMAFVTVGSVVNLCDLLVSGGTSRADHSEIGSGFIHFNFTPWGARGDKATASLVGDVVRGALLRERRIFLGGAGGMVGPRAVGFGAIAGAGQVVRRDIAAGKLSVQVPRAVSRVHEPDFLDPAPARIDRNVAYVAQLVALRQWYRHVRLPRAGDASPVIEAALSVLGACIDERVKRLSAFAAERNAAMPALALDGDVAPPASLLATLQAEGDHIAWVQALPEAVVDDARAWLQAVATSVTNPA